jgi:hypothetical protein
VVGAGRPAALKPGAQPPKPDKREHLFVGVVVAVPHRPEKREPRPLLAGAPQNRSAVTLIPQSLPDGVVDLAAFRWRPWPGWWGCWHLATWSVAERSRRAS